jgi:hypothetical protein
MPLQLHLYVINYHCTILHIEILICHHYWNLNDILKILAQILSILPSKYIF